MLFALFCVSQFGFKGCAIRAILRLWLFIISNSTSRAIRAILRFCLDLSIVQLVLFALFCVSQFGFKGCAIRAILRFCLDLSIVQLVLFVLFCVSQFGFKGCAIRAILRLWLFIISNSTSRAIRAILRFCLDLSILQLVLFALFCVSQFGFKGCAIRAILRLWLFIISNSTSRAIRAILRFCLDLSIVQLVLFALFCVSQFGFIGCAIRAILRLWLFIISNSTSRAIRAILRFCLDLSIVQLVLFALFCVSQFGFKGCAIRAILRLWLFIISNCTSRAIRAILRFCLDLSIVQLVLFALFCVSQFGFKGCAIRAILRLWLFIIINLYKLVLFVLFCVSQFGYKGCAIHTILRLWLFIISSTTSRAIRAILRFCLDLSILQLVLFALFCVSQFGFKGCAIHAILRLWLFIISSTTSRAIRAILRFCLDVSILQLVLFALFCVSQFSIKCCDYESL